jgi:hypothetical protein
MPPRSTSTARCTWPTASLTQVEQALHLLNTIPVKPNGTPSEWQLVTASDAPDVRHPQWGLIVTWCPPASNTRRFFNVRHHRNASGIGRVGAEPLRGWSDRTTATQLTVAIRDALRGIRTAPPPAPLLTTLPPPPDPFRSPSLIRSETPEDDFESAGSDFGSPPIGGGATSPPPASTPYYY